MAYCVPVGQAIYLVDAFVHTFNATFRYAKIRYRTVALLKVGAWQLAVGVEWDCKVPQNKMFIILVYYVLCYLSYLDNINSTTLIYA